jgi:hypothetical protein
MIPVLDVCVVTIGLWDFDNKNNVDHREMKGSHSKQKSHIVTYCQVVLSRARRTKEINSPDKCAF